jgi:hypothetical protein
MARLRSSHGYGDEHDKPGHAASERSGRLWERHAGRRRHLGARARADETWAFRPARWRPLLHSGLNIQCPVLVGVEVDRRFPSTCSISENQVRDIPVLSGAPGCSRARCTSSLTGRRRYGGRRGRRTFHRPAVNGLCVAANSLPSSASSGNLDDLRGHTRSWQDDPAYCQPGRGRRGPAVGLHECADRGGERRYGADDGNDDRHPGRRTGRSRRASVPSSAPRPPWPAGHKESVASTASRRQRARPHPQRDDHHRRTVPTREPCRRTQGPDGGGGRWPAAGALPRSSGAAPSVTSESVMPVPASYSEIICSLLGRQAALRLPLADWRDVLSSPSRSTGCPAGRL